MSAKSHAIAQEGLRERKPSQAPENESSSGGSGMNTPQDDEEVKGHTASIKTIGRTPDGTRKYPLAGFGSTVLGSTFLVSTGMVLLE